MDVRLTNRKTLITWVCTVCLDLFCTQLAVTRKEFFSMRQWPFIIQNQCDILKTNVTFSNSNVTYPKIILNIEPWPNFQPIILYFPSFLSLMTRLLRQILIWRRWQTLFRRRRHSVYNLRGVRFCDIRDRLFIGLTAGQCLRWNWVKWLILSGWFK